MAEQSRGVVLAQQREQALAVGLGGKRPRAAGTARIAGSGHDQWAGRTMTAVP